MIGLRKKRHVSTQLEKALTYISGDNISNHSTTIASIFLKSQLYIWTLAQQKGTSTAIQFNKCKFTSYIFSAAVHFFTWIGILNSIPCYKSSYQGLKLLTFSLRGEQRKGCTARRRSLETEQQFLPTAATSRCSVLEDLRKEGEFRRGKRVKALGFRVWGRLKGTVPMQEEPFSGRRWWGPRRQRAAELGGGLGSPAMRRTVASGSGNASASDPPSLATRQILPPIRKKSVGWFSFPLEGVFF
jgi:hypothetical protein